VPPFPFRDVAKMSTPSSSSNVLVMLTGQGQSLEVFSVKSAKQLLRLDKKGDFGIKCFDVYSSLPQTATHFVVYSDGLDT